MIWWTKSWNPAIGCTKCSPACDNCYAEALHTQRHKAKLAGAPMPLCYAEPFDRVRFLPERLTQPLHWRKPQRIFACNMGDMFHEDVPFEVLDRIFAVMALSPQHTFMLCTKRPQRMAEYLKSSGRVRAICKTAGRIAMDAAPDPDTKYGSKAFYRFLHRLDEGRLTAWTHKGSCAEELFLRNGGGEHPSWVIWPLPNVWLGTTIWDQPSADRAVPILLDTPAAKRFVSYEPALGPVDLRPWLPGPCQHPECSGGSVPVVEMGVVQGGRPCPWCECGPSRRLDLVLLGGETGAKARPMHPDWPRKVRDDCVAAGVPFFFKQWGEWAEGDEDGKHDSICLTHDGRDWHKLPNDELTPQVGGTVCMVRLGARKAGRVLDGRTWEEVPA